MIPLFLILGFWLYIMKMACCIWVHWVWIAESWSFSWWVSSLATFILLPRTSLSNISFSKNLLYLTAFELNSSVSLLSCAISLAIELIAAFRLFRHLVALSLFLISFFNLMESTSSPCFPLDSFKCVLTSDMHMLLDLASEGPSSSSLWFSSITSFTFFTGWNALSLLEKIKFLFLTVWIHFTWEERKNYCLRGKQSMSCALLVTILLLCS